MLVDLENYNITIDTNFIQCTASSGTDIGSGGSSGSQYVIWDPNMLKSGLNQMKEWAGTAFNLGLWVFLIISGISIVISIVRSLFG